jgi:predicted metal-binding protein
MKGKAVRPAKTRWREVVFVCGECSGDPGSLRKRLKKELKRQEDGKAFRIIRTKCMGICPRDAVTVGLGRDLAQERPRLHIVRDDATKKDLRALIEA